MGARSAAREAALQMLYAADIAHQEPETLISDFWREFPGDAEDRSYADGVVRGVLSERPQLDEAAARMAAQLASQPARSLGRARSQLTELMNTAGKLREEADRQADRAGA